MRVSKACFEECRLENSIESIRVGTNTTDHRQKSKAGPTSLSQKAREVEIKYNNGRVGYGEEARLLPLLARVVVVISWSRAAWSKRECKD